MTVLDETGAPLPHARVNFINLKTGHSDTNSADLNGRACASALLGEYALTLPPGKYTVSVTVPHLGNYSYLKDFSAPGAVYHNLIHVGDNK